MAVIHMGKSTKEAWNPNRPVSSLLEWQVEHLHEAERRLPRHLHTDIYVNAITTEGEAAEYIQAVTEAIHQAHAAAEARRGQAARRRAKHPLADETAERKQKSRAKKKRSRKPKGKK